MAIEYILPEDPIEQEDYDQFIADFGLNLPAAYQAHILANNGGSPLPNIFIREDGEEFGIAVFYAIKNGEPHNELSQLLNLYYNDEEPMLSRDYFPFAYDDGGNCFCIVTSGPEVGKIYLIYFDATPPHFLANSFEAFMAGIQEDPDYLL